MTGVSRLGGTACDSAAHRSSRKPPMLPDQTARSVAERWARKVFLEDDPGGHVLLVLIHADQHEGQRAVRLRPEVEAKAGASRLREKLIDHFARKVTAALL